MVVLFCGLYASLVSYASGFSGAVGLPVWVFWSLLGFRHCLFLGFRLSWVSGLVAFRGWGKLEQGSLCCAAFVKSVVATFGQRRIWLAAVTSPERISGRIALPSVCKIQNGVCCRNHIRHLCAMRLDPFSVCNVLPSDGPYRRGHQRWPLFMREEMAPIRIGRHLEAKVYVFIAN